MNSFTNERLEELKIKFKNKRIAIVGDMMLDCYFWGDVKRISPEAPVPVVEVDNEFYRFGGAANVALNIIKLGSIPIPVGVVGNDNNALIFADLMTEAGISNEGIIKDNDRPTTIKTRVIANNQHVVRIDKESKKNISEVIENSILEFFKNNIKNIDGVILQDYNKGVLTYKVIKGVIDIANANNKIITVDPKFNNFYEYKNVTVFKPNRKEAQDATGMTLNTNDEINKVGEHLLEKLNAKYILVTLGEGGSALFQHGKEERKTPTKARKVRDVSGAGDTVISTMTASLVAGANIDEAAYLANFAGGLVCEEVGIVPIEVEKLFNAIKLEIV
ncbi:MAG: D-glycero-beta-D-manno-heptose-7-phosphate kinase [bacterium]